MSEKPNFDLIISKVIEEFIKSKKEQDAMIRLPLKVSLPESLEILNLLKRMRS